MAVAALAAIVVAPSASASASSAANGVVQPAGASAPLAGGARPPVPEVIKVPAGNKRIAFMPARGVQTYQCVGGAWTFQQPDAILEHKGRAEVLHSRGPVWTSVRDGSSVTAAVQASSPVPNAVPQLLLVATGHRVPGLLAEVTFVQRLNTRGGVSPTGACTDGVTASVPYTADYTFWVAV